jgi:hypothetical protein
MPENSNKESENPPVDTESWELAFEAYKGHPDAALNMGYNLVVLASYLKVEPLLIEEALEGLERAIEALYPYTQFHGVCHNMYLKVVGGKLTLEEEEMLKKLGLKF